MADELQRRRRQSRWCRRDVPFSRGCITMAIVGRFFFITLFVRCIAMAIARRFFVAFFVCCITMAIGGRICSTTRQPTRAAVRSRRPPWRWRCAPGSSGATGGLVLGPMAVGRGSVPWCAVQRTLHILGVGLAAVEGVAAAAVGEGERGGAAGGGL